MVKFLVYNGKETFNFEMPRSDLEYRGLTHLKDEIFKITKIKNENNIYILANNSFLVNDKYFSKYLLRSDDNMEIKLDILYKLRGGIIDAIINLLENIGKLLLGIVKIIIQFFEMFNYVFEMIPLVFDPPRLIDDILFAVSTSISVVLDKLMNSIDVQAKDDDPEESGPMGLNKRVKEKVCLPPTMTQILFLILCPPLAIFFKFDFMRAIIPVIICGVLCVKLYYFPGLLFATLMTLC